MEIIKGIIGKLYSRKLIVTLLIVAGVVTGSITLTLPMALVACCYLVSQAVVDTWRL